MGLSGLERAARPSSQGRALEPAGDRRSREMTVAPQGEQNPAYSPEPLFYREFRKMVELFCFCASTMSGIQRRQQEHKNRAGQTALPRT